jgi:RNA polymerase sigma-70 factor (ECF subfamily)
MSRSSRSVPSAPGMTDPPGPSQSSNVKPAVQYQRPLTPPLSEAEFGTLYESEFSYVWHALRRLGVPERDREDLCHDVFMVLYRTWPDYDTARPLRPWLFGIAFRVASDYRRRARHRFEVPGECDSAATAPVADEHVAQAEQRRLIQEALATLDLDRRAVFVMHELDGHAMPEIATALAVPLNTCYSRLRLARQQFAAAIRRRRPGESTP